MTKQIKTIFGKKYYLLGKGKDGANYWLEAPSWDCGWYWGFGYVETFTNNKNPEKSRDIVSHDHFDRLFLTKDKNDYDVFKEFFAESVLNDEETWKLLDYMNTAYVLKSTAEIFNHGGSNYTEKAYLENLKDKNLEDKINKEMLPEIFEKVSELLA